MTDSDTWNKAYATALYEFALFLENNQKKADNPMTIDEAIAKMREFADAVYLRVGQK